MIRTTLACFVMILTNIVAAEAGFNEINETRVAKASWTAAYVGETVVDNIPVLAALETAENEIVIPEMITGDMQTLVPLAPIKKKLYRITLTALENPNLKAAYKLEAQTASVDGQLRKVFLSSPDSDIRFLITTEADGMLRAQFTKEVSPSILEQGEFRMEPAMRPLRK